MTNNRSWIHKLIHSEADCYSYQNLSEKDLSGLNFRGSIFEQTNLRWTSFRSADLSYCNFSGADLYSANLMHSNLSKSNLLNANLENAHLNGAIIKDTKGLITLSSPEFFLFIHHSKFYKKSKTNTSIQINHKFMTMEFCSELLTRMPEVFISHTKITHKSIPLLINFISQAGGVIS